MRSLIFTLAIGLSACASPPQVAFQPATSYASSAPTVEVPPEPESTSRAIPEVKTAPCDFNAFGPVRDRALQATVRAQTKASISATTARLDQLLIERNKLDMELEFYPSGKYLPRELRRLLEDSNYEIIRTKSDMNRYRCFLAQIEAQP